MSIRRTKHIKLFAYSVTLIVADKLPNEAAELNSDLDKDTPAACIAEGRKAWVLIRRKDCSVSLLAHEMGHAASFLLETIGARPTVADDEVHAYITEYLMSWAMKVLRKANIKVLQE